MRRFKLGSGHNRYGLLDSAGPCWVPLHNETCEVVVERCILFLFWLCGGSSGFTLLPPPLVLRANTSRLFVRFTTIPLLSLALAVSASALIRIMLSICTVHCFILRSFMHLYCVPLPSPPLKGGSSSQRLLSTSQEDMRETEFIYSLPSHSWSNNARLPTAT